MAKNKALVLQVRSSLSELKKEIKFYQKQSYKANIKHLKNVYQVLTDQKKDNLNRIQRFYQNISKNKPESDLRRIITKIKKLDNYDYPPEFLLQVEEEVASFQKLEDNIRTEQLKMIEYRKLFYQTAEPQLKLFFEMLFKMQRQSFKLFYPIFDVLEKNKEE